MFSLVLVCVSVCLLATLRENGWLCIYIYIYIYSEYVGLCARNNLEHFQDVPCNPLNTGKFFLLFVLMMLQIISSAYQNQRPGTNNEATFLKKIYLFITSLLMWSSAKLTSYFPEREQGPRSVYVARQVPSRFSSLTWGVEYQWRVRLPRSDEAITKYGRNYSYKSND